MCIRDRFHEGNFIKSRTVTPEDAIEIAANYRGEQVIVIPDEDSITFNLTLPKTALRSLEQLIESEIQTQTPFDASEVNVSYDITSTDNGEVSIGAQIVPKLKLNEIMDKAKTFGLSPIIAIVNKTRMSEAENINFFQKTELHRRSGSLSKVLGVAL